MIIATPSELYDSSTASGLLKPFPKAQINAEIVALNDDRVVMKSKRDVDTGRTYGFTQTYVKFCPHNRNAAHILAGGRSSAKDRFRKDFMRRPRDWTTSLARRAERSIGRSSAREGSWHR